MAIIESSANILNSARPLVTAYFASNTAMSNGGTVIFDTKLFDVASSYNNSTGLFTAPVAGKYLVICGWAGTTTVSNGGGFFVVNDIAAAASWNLYSSGGPIGQTGGSLISSGYGGVILSLAASSTMNITCTVNTNFTLIGGSNPMRAWMSVLQVD